MARLFGCAVAIGITSFVGCGARVYRPPIAVNTADLKIENERVADAFGASPQTPLPARVAVYARTEALAQQIADALPGTQGIESAYVIHNYLMTGQPRWQPMYGYGYGNKPPEFDLEEIRIAAARAHCDVLVVVDSGSRVRAKANAWTALSPLLITNLMTPFLKATDEAYLDTSVFDVRNGYLYGQVVAEEQNERGPVTLYALERAEPRDALMETLIAQTRDEVGDLLWHHLMTDRADRADQPDPPTAQPPAPPPAPVQVQPVQIVPIQVQPVPAPPVPARSAPSPAGPARTAPISSPPPPPAPSE